MPYLTEDGNLLCCESNEISEFLNVRYRQWRAVKNGEAIEFPHSPANPFKVHCSPVEINGILNISYGGEIYFRDNGQWKTYPTKVWSGYWDGRKATYVKGNELWFGDDFHITPFEKALRVVPWERGILVTGQTANKQRTLSFNGNEWQEVLVEKQPVYKCHIRGNKIVYSKSEGGVEGYRIHESNDFQLVPYTHPN